MKNRYEKELLNASIKLDAISDTSGTITSLTKKILKEEDCEALCSLYSELNRILDYKKSGKETIAFAKYVDDCLLRYFGYKKIKEITQITKVNYETKTLPELFDELDKLVGLEIVKEQVKDLVAFQMVNQRRVEKGLRATQRTLHLAFIGNPGTGKTTVARIIGRMYKELGLLSKGHFIEVSRTDLIAGYQGQTALKVKKVIENAKGGVLFIDEAYSITENDNSDSYGRECLTELTKALEDYREDLVVIVAGYTEPMSKFFESNPGLKSRFNTFISFCDYSEEQLLEIIENMCQDSDYILDESAKQKILNYLKKAIESHDNNFANGRLARNIFEKMTMNHARRIADKKDATREELSTILSSDFSEE